MRRIGITGGIGSGKTTVSKIFEVFGVPVYRSDDRARELSNSHKNIQASIVELLGEESILPEGNLNRVFVASQVFNNQHLLKSLNEIIHPYVENDFNDWCSMQSSRWILKEAAILFETGNAKLLDKILVIDAPVELCIKRVMMRNSLSRQEVIERMNAQWSREMRLQHADFVIVNNDVEAILPQALHLFNRLNESV